MLRLYRRRRRALLAFLRAGPDLDGTRRVLALLPPRAFVVFPLDCAREALPVLRGLAARRRPVGLTAFLAVLTALRTVFFAR